MKFITSFTKILVLSMVFTNIFVNISTKKVQKKSNKRTIHRMSNRAKHLAAFLVQRGERTDDDIPDPVVISDIKIVSSSKPYATCPYPMQYVKGSCKSAICDLNDGKGGEFIHLCVAKKKISEFGKDDNLVTTIKVNVNNQDCGNLKTLNTKIRDAWILSNDLYICYGEEEDRKPIKELELYFSEKDVPKECNIQLSPGKFICPYFADKAPKSIEYSDITMLTSDDNFKNLEKPETLGEIDNDNGSAKDPNTVKRSLIATQVKSSAWNIENKFGAKVDVKFTVKTCLLVGGKASVSSTFDINYSQNQGEVQTSSDTTQIDFSCMAPAGKHYKCRASVDKYEASVPYTVKRTVTYADNSKETKIIKNQFYGVMSSSIKFDRCCYRGCTSGVDKICDDAPQNSADPCPKLQGETTQAPENTKVEDIVVSKELDSELITDIVVTEGKYTSCPNGYVVAMCHEKGKVCDFQHSTLDVNDIHFCLKKTTLFKTDGLPINAIRISKYNQDCGTLQLAKVSLNQGNIYLCYGHDHLAPLAPITDIVVTKTAKGRQEVISKQYVCDENTVTEDRYLCYKRNKNAPKRVEMKDFAYDTTKMKKQLTGAPKKVNEIIVSGSTVLMAVKSTKRTDTSLKKSFNFGIAVSLGITGSFGVVETAATGTASHRQSRTSEVKEAVENTEMSTIECVAPEGKKVKCVSSVLEYKVTMPYKAKLVSYDYEGKEMINFVKEITGTFEGLNVGNLSVKSCCIEGCCMGEVGESAKKAHCDGTKKDILCADLDKCFTPAPKKTLRRRRFLK